jgi:hypothetical protein
MCRDWEDCREGFNGSGRFVTMLTMLGINGSVGTPMSTHRLAVAIFSVISSLSLTLVCRELIMYLWTRSAESLTVVSRKPKVGLRGTEKRFSPTTHWPLPLSQCYCSVSR